MVTITDIEKLGTLARIALSDEEKRALVADIDSILGYVGQIQSVHLNAQIAPSVVSNVFREDENSHESGIFTPGMIALAPNKEGNYIKVKKILPS